jgi:hypothetical protein
MKFAKKICSIVCDDIREETKNKFSLMGVYGKEIIFNKLPIVMPKLCIVIMFEDVKEKFNELTLTLKMPKAKPKVFERKFSEDVVPGANFNLISGFSPFRVEAPGEVRFEVKIADSKRINYVHRLRMRKQAQS